MSDDELAREIESFAVRLARGAGEVLAGRFGRRLSVEYKDKAHRDPVTDADKGCQDYLAEEIARRFPGHGILGEEGSEGRENVSSDFLWVLDPLDGTINFLNGLPVYASSIGVLHRGLPLAGAIYVPWPKPGGGFVLHSRRGGGCFADDDPVSVYESDEPAGNRLAGLPGSFAHAARFTRKVRSRAGETRTTGSAAYELAMTACGVLQYTVLNAPHLWDVAAGAPAVIEAGGTVMARLPGEKRWRPLNSLVPDWEQRPPGLTELRGWVAPAVAGNRRVAPLIAGNIRPRFRLSAGLRRVWPTRQTKTF